MKIKDLEKLMEQSNKHDQDSEKFQFICDMHDEIEFVNEEIAYATLQAYKNIVFSTKDPSDQDKLICSIGRILNSTKMTEYANLRQVDTFILLLSQAKNIYVASQIEEIVISYIENMSATLGDLVNDEYITIYTSDVYRLSLLVSTLSKIDSTNLLIPILKLYETNSDIFDYNMSSIFTGTNENGTILATNILKNMFDKENLSLDKLIELANSKDEYIPIEKAVEENVATEGLQELMKNFPNIDMPYDEYYVKRPKEKTESHEEDKNKSMIKTNSNTVITE